jgi:putative protein-disulfide isomerase
VVNQATRPAPTLHYIYDPLCGWCYGAAPLVRAARTAVRVEAHAGGMLTGATRRAITPEWRQMVMGHDRRIAQASGQPFGPAYVDGLLHDPSVVLDSAPPITAVLAAQTLAGTGLALLARLQQAHYVEGRRIGDAAVLVELAGELGLDQTAFVAAYADLQGAATLAHIEQSRALLARVGGHGFPTFALEHDGRFTTVDVGPDIGQPEVWLERLKAQL